MSDLHEDGPLLHEVIGALEEELAAATERAVQAERELANAYRAGVDLARHLNEVKAAVNADRARLVEALETQGRSFLDAANALTFGKLLEKGHGCSSCQDALREAVAPVSRDGRLSTDGAHARTEG